MKQYVLSLVVIMGIIVSSTVAFAQQPVYDTAVVNGDIAEWNVELDSFADMYRAGKVDNAVESKLYLRYDCQTSTLFALVLAEPGVDVLVQPDDAFIKLDGEKLVDGMSGSFAWVDSDGQTAGWEASAIVAPGMYSNLNIHTQVFSAGASQTSAVAGRAIGLSIVCSVPPVDSPVDPPVDPPSSVPEPSTVFLLGVGLLGLLGFTRRKRG